MLLQGLQSCWSMIPDGCITQTLSSELLSDR